MDCLLSSLIVSWAAWLPDVEAWDGACGACMLLMHKISSESLVVLVGFRLHDFGFPLEENPDQCCRQSLFCVIVKKLFLVPLLLHLLLWLHSWVGWGACWIELPLLLLSSSDCVWRSFDCSQSTFGEMWCSWAACSLWRCVPSFHMLCMGWMCQALSLRWVSESMRLLLQWQVPLLGWIGQTGHHWFSEFLSFVLSSLICRIVSADSLLFSGGCQRTWNVAWSGVAGCVAF